MLKSKLNITEKNLFEDLSLLIENSKKLVFSQANSIQVLLFWQLGKRINKFVLSNNRAEYGKEIVVTISRQLVQAYGRSFEEKNLRRMLQFADKFNDHEKVVTLSRHLSWSHFLALIPVKNSDAQLYYAHNSINESWSVRDLRKQIEKKSFERSVVANTQTVVGTENVFKDPYLLDFLGQDKAFLEKDLETAILIDIEKFIMELGKGFSFVERQKRMTIDDDDFYLDLLFFHRKLKRLIAIELKIGKFKAKYKGQMELYLKWLNKYEKQEGEQSPIGLILCTETSNEQIELLEMHKDGIIVAEYWTELPPKKILEEKIKIAYEKAQIKLENKTNEINKQ